MGLTASALNRFQKATATQAGEQVNGGTIFLNSRPYKVTVVSQRGTLELSNGGFVQARTVEIIARDAVLPRKELVDLSQASQPLKPNFFTYDGVSYQIKNVVTDPTGFQHHISAIEKGALK